MKGVELYGQVRRAVYVQGLSRREAARGFGIDPRTVAKMLAFCGAGHAAAYRTATALYSGENFRRLPLPLLSMTHSYRTFVRLGVSTQRRQVR